jgi:hypothetical protein
MKVSLGLSTVEAALETVIENVAAPPTKPGKNAGERCVIVSL